MPSCRFPVWQQHHSLASPSLSLSSPSPRVLPEQNFWYRHGWLAILAELKNILWLTFFIKDFTIFWGILGYLSVLCSIQDCFYPLLITIHCWLSVHWPVWPALTRTTHPFQIRCHICTEITVTSCCNGHSESIWDWETSNTIARQFLDRKKPGVEGTWRSTLQWYVDIHLQQIRAKCMPGWLVWMSQVSWDDTMRNCWTDEYGETAHWHEAMQGGCYTIQKEAGIDKTFAILPLILHKEAQSQSSNRS